MPVTDGHRQILIVGVVTAVNVGPSCNMKIIDGWWQNYVAGDTFTFVDAKGLTFKYEAATNLQPVAIGKLDWIEGPLTITTTGSANQTIYFIQGTK